MTEQARFVANDARAEAEWWRGGAIYQVYPRSFQDTFGTGSGDLRGVTRRVAHIASLGVDAIWLSPFFKSPMADMGYDVSDYRAVDPMFGSMEDFDALVAETHRHGMKLIVDQVISHSSDRHEWFAESRTDRTNARADWYVWADPKPDGGAPNNWLSIFGGPAWEWDSVRRQYYLHNFLAAQPDLNFHNPAVQDAVLADMRFWLERGVDGFRLDTANYYFHDRWLRDNPPMAEAAARTIAENNPYLYQYHLFDKTQPENLDFLKRLRALLDDFGAVAVGEVGDEQRSLQTVAAYTQGRRLHMCYTFDLLSPRFSAQHVRACVEEFERGAPDGWICWAMSNHDVMRHVSRWTRPGQDGDAVARFAISLLACLRGSICIYQGEELGLQEAELAFEDLRDPYGIRFWPGFKGRDGCRTPMVWERGSLHAGFSVAKPWLPVPEAHLARAADTQEADQRSVLAHYRAVLKLRARHRALTVGSIRFLDAGAAGADADLLAFVREQDRERLLCLFNFGSEPASWRLPQGEGAFGEALWKSPRTRIAGDALSLPPLGSFLCRLG
jgi:alpha-glucosidase